MRLEGQRVLVIGAARSGLATAQFLARQRAVVYLNDIKSRESFAPESLDALEKEGVRLLLGAHPDLDSLALDLIVLSPGVPISVEPVQIAQARGLAVISEIELAARFCRAPMVAVTGTNGKTTTTALIGQIFSDAGHAAFVGGNIGVPFIGRAAELMPGDVAVLEASSFQLEATERFKPKVALVLNLTPDHIDRHGSFTGYIDAKTKIYANQDKNDWLILNYDDEETKKLAAEAPARVIFFSRKHILKEGFCVENGYLTAKMDGSAAPVLKPEEITIKGGHNLENALAATAAGWVMGVPAESIASTLRTFPGVPHRLEHVLVHRGVEYINDSKGTNPDASIKALEAYDRPVVLIAGGKSKGTDFLPFAQRIKEKAKALVLVGQAADELEEAMNRVGYTGYVRAETFRQAVELAASLAAAGEIVLLSPACASYDMFSNYEERGEVFKKLVRDLASGG